MKHLVPFVAMLCVAGTCEWVPTDTDAPPPTPTVGMTVLGMEAGDSLLGITVSWTEPPPGGVRRHPIAGYEVRVIDSVTTDSLGTDYVGHPATVDTIWMPMLPLDSTMWLYSAVATRDTKNQLSGWTHSTPATEMMIPSLPPLPPDSITPPDTVPVPLVSWTVLPNRVIKIERDSTGRAIFPDPVYFCAFGRTADSTPVRMQPEGTMAYQACDSLWTVFGEPTSGAGGV